MFQLVVFPWKQGNGGDPQGAQNSKSTAGIDASYADIKKHTVPAAKF